MAAASRNKENKPFPPTRADASILSLSRTPHSEEFFTDSLLDASKIPTPSPKKPQAFSAAAKGRRALGNTRTLKDAWNATDPSARPQFTSGGANWSSPPLRPLAREEQRQNPPLREVRQRTPSPQPNRRPYLSHANSDIASPPPRGLTDVYQQIAEEEFLADQEGDFEDDATEEMMPEGITDDFMNQPEPPRRSPFLPTNHQRLATYTEDDPQKENLNVDDAVSMSDPSGMSFINQLTDQDLAVKLTPHTVDHAKDRARIQRAVQSQRPIAFRHGYKSRLGLTKENLGNHGTSHYQDDRPPSSTGSIKTDRSEPPPNVPKAWGSKSREGKEWLRARREGSRSSPIPEPSQLDWASAAAQIALPSVEDSSTPTSGNQERPYLQRQSSLDRIRHWDMNDLTGQSFQVSQSPSVKLQTRHYDPEIRHLEKQALTTNRLGEIRERSSQEQLSKTRSAGQVPPADNVDTEDAPLLTDQGEAIPNTPVVIYRSSSTSSRSEKANGAIERRLTSESNKSLEHLQRLARATSNSPRASPSPDNHVLIEHQPPRNHVTSDRNEDVAWTNGETSRKSSKEVAHITDTPQRNGIGDTAKTPVVTGAWIDTILPDTVRTTRKVEKPASYAQTPHITAGGWIDTPATSRRNISSLAPIPLEQVPEELVEGITRDPSQSDKSVAIQSISDMPSEAQKSALVAILDRAKRRLASQDITSAPRGNNNTPNDTLNLGEATLESLEDLLSLDANDMTTLIRLGAEADAQELLLNAAQRNDPAAEAEMLERLSTKLERLRTNIHDARRGISKLESQVSRGGVSGHVSELVLSHGDSASTVIGPRPSTWFPSFLTSSSSSSSLIPQPMYILLPIPQLFHPGGRPTKLGTILFALCAWYVLECALAETYAHPVHADVYSWPLRPEPRFPFVMPVVLGRWIGFDISGFGGAFGALWSACWIVCRMVVRIAMRALGLWDGFVDDHGAGAGLRGMPVGAGGRGGMDGGVGGYAGEGGAAWSMMNDDLI